MSSLEQYRPVSSHHRRVSDRLTSGLQHYPLEDCVSDTNCDVIYEAMKSPLVGSVPPSQARDFEIGGVGDRDVRFKGKLRWNYSLTEVRATK